MFPRLVTTVALALFGAACAGGRSARVAPPLEATPPDSVFVEVVNDNFYDARVHVVYEGGARYPIGTIGGHQQQPGVAVPWQPRLFAVEVMFVVDGSVYRSDRIDVVKGDVLQVRVPPNIEASGFFRRISR